MHRSTDGRNPLNMSILTRSKEFNNMLTLGHMTMFVVKYFVIQIIGQSNGSINKKTDT